MSPTPINYLHVKYIAPLLRLASEIVRRKSGESDAQSGIELGSSFRFHALVGTLKVVVH